MDLLMGPMGRLSSKLLELLKEEYKLQKGVRVKVQSLSQELKCMHAALHKVAAVPWDQLDEQVKIWAREVREASYDIEDILDSFFVRVDGHEVADLSRLERALKKMGDLFSKGKARREISCAIEDITKQIQQMTERHARFKIDDLVAKPAATTSIDPRLLALYTKVSQLVGIEEPRDKVIQMLTPVAEEMETKILSIVGFGGLGKTTLAKAVYDNLIYNFHFKAFVPVGQNPDVKTVLKDILIDLDKQRYTTEFNLAIFNVKQLIDELREFLKDKRYFIVIDDIWDVPSWNIIRSALDNNSLGSKIVVTTRKHDVAAKVAGYSYNMEPLPQESSKVLFYGRIFGCEDKCPKQFVEVSEKIIKKCGGVPLAIITTSGLLVNKLGNIKDWYEYCESIGLGLGSNPDMENMRKILSFSYYDLPAHLKTCLLYLSVFPEDYKIDMDRLIWRWIAEDFMPPIEGGQSLFNLGVSYFIELVNRSLIQPADMNKEGFPTACRVHDMVLDLICSISRQESFAATMLGDAMQNIPFTGSKVRRLSLLSSTCPTMDMSKLRSLTIFSGDIIKSMQSLSCHHFLRVLDLEGCRLGDNQDLSFVSHLFHLRYLGVTKTGYAGELPSEIGKLQFLQTLNIFLTKIKELPSSIIVSLRKLMCLYLNWGICLPNGLRNLTSLEVLWCAVVDSVHIAEELGHLTKLRILTVELKIHKDGGRDESQSICNGLVESLGKLHMIQRLVVISKVMALNLDGSMESLGNLSFLRIRKVSLLPTWIKPGSLLLLSFLDITVAQVRREDMQLLGLLQALRFLQLSVYDFDNDDDQDIKVLERFTVGPDAFPSARDCRFYGFLTVPSMVPQGAMPRLENFRFCIRKEAFAEGELTTDELSLGHLPSLQSVSIYHNCRKEESSCKAEEVVREDEERSGKEVELEEEERNAEEDEVIMEVKAKLMQEADVHPNHPSIHIKAYSKWERLTDN